MRRTVGARCLILMCTLTPFASLAPFAPIAAQGTTQLVGTGTVVHPYSRKITYVGEVSPSAQIEGSPDYWEIGIDGGIEYTATPAIDLLAYQFFIVNNQIGGIHSFEARTRLGVVPHWRPRSEVADSGSSDRRRSVYHL